MDIIEKNPYELIPYENNPRVNEVAVEKVMDSIMEFGFKVPIVIDKDGVVVAGHTRLLAAKRLEMDSVPCTIADDLTDEQIRAYRLADNKTAELAEWDFDLLREELLNMDDMEKYGFSEQEVGGLVESKTTTKESQAEEEDIVIRCPRCGAEVKKA